MAEGCKTVHVPEIKYRFEAHILRGSTLDELQSSKYPYHPCTVYIDIYLHLGSFGGRISRMRYGIGCALQTIFLTFFDVDVKFIS